MNIPHRSYYFTDPWSTAAAHAARRSDIEAELCAELLADPYRLVPLATAAGVTCASFVEEDRRLIYAGCEVAHENQLPLPDTLCAIGRALHAAGYWSDSPPPPPPWPPTWSWSSLVRLACSRYYAPSVVAHRCAELLDLDRRERDAAHHLRVATALLAGASVPTPSLRRVVAVAAGQEAA